MTAYVNALQNSVFVTVYFGVLFFATPLWAPELLLCDRGGRVKAERGPGFRPADLWGLLPFLIAANLWHIPVYAGNDPVGALLPLIGVNGFVIGIWIFCLRFMRRRGIEQTRLLFQLCIYPLAVVGAAGIIMNLLLLGGVFMSTEKHGPNVIANGLAIGSVFLMCTGVCLLSRYLFRRMVRVEAQSVS